MNPSFTKTEIEPGLVVLGVKGSVVCGPECDRFEAQVNQLIEEKRKRVILDLSAVSTMDSAAIGLVVRCFKKLKATGGDLRLACPPPVIARSLEQTRVNKIVATFATVADAAGGFAPPAPAED